MSLRVVKFRLMARIKDLPSVDRPREKLLKYGVNKLLDTELLAILLGNGIKGSNVLNISHKIVNLIKIKGYNKIEYADLIKINGLGTVKVLQVLSVLELCKRFTSNKQIEILSAKDIWLLCSDIKQSKKEHFVVFYLDVQNRVIERQIMSIGTLDTSLVHPREVYEPAVTLHASSIIIAHNHPSGIIEPSENDIKITKVLVKAGEILGIKLENHIILTEKSYFSFKSKILIQY